MSAEEAVTQDSGIRHKVVRLPAAPHATTIITQIDDAFLNGDVVQQLVIDAAVRGIVRAYLDAHHENIVAAIDPHLVARLAQVELAQQTLQHLRSTAK